MPGTKVDAENREIVGGEQHQGQLRCAVPLACNLTHCDLSGSYIRADL